METYSLSFTAASMRFYDFRRLMDAGSQAGGADPDPSVVVGSDNRRTNTRVFRELLHRFRQASALEKALFPTLDVGGQKQLAFLLITRAYPLIRDFQRDVVREKFLTLDRHLLVSDFRTCLHRKADMHPELDGFADSTRDKARQVLWRILEEAGILDNVRSAMIQPQILHPILEETLRAQDPSDLELFFLGTSFPPEKNRMP